MYGGAHIYVKKKFDDMTQNFGYYVEINGEVVPVSKISDDQGIIYKIYDLNNDNGYQIQWEGERCLFDEKTSIYVSEDLKQTIKPICFSEKISAGMLSAPDSNGLRHAANGDTYLIIKGKYIKLKKAESEPGIIERYSIRQDDGTIIYVRLKDDSSFHIESIDEWLEFMHRLSAVNAEKFNNKVDSEHLYEEIYFSNEMPEIKQLDYKIIDGKNTINIQGENREVFWNWNNGHPEIILKKMDGHSMKMPVYMEVISKNWHVSKYRNRSFFSKKTY